MSPDVVRMTPADTTDDGVIAPSVNVMAGVEVGLATEPDTPLAVATETVGPGWFKQPDARIMAQGLHRNVGQFGKVTNFEHALLLRKV